MTLARQVLQKDRENHHLPGVALTKVREMETQLEQHFAVSRQIGDKLRDEIRFKESLNRELRMLEESGSRNSAPQIQSTREAIDLQIEKITDLSAQADDDRKRRTSRFANLSTLRNWIDLRQGDKLTVFVGKSADHGRKSGEEWESCVGRHRLRLAQLRAEIHRVTSAQIPAVVAKQRARKEIDRLAETGTPNIEACLEGGEILWPRSDLTTGWGELVAHNVPATMPLFFWLFRDQIIDRVEGEIDSLADPSQALSDAQRQKAKADLLAQILEIERAEESAITAASAQRIEIDRRVDADPRAVLGLAANVPGLDADQLSEINEAADE